MIQEDRISGGLKGLEQSIGGKYAQIVCLAFPSENLYIYQKVASNRRLLAILPREVVVKVVEIFGGSAIALPQGAKFLKKERNLAILKDRQAGKLTIPSLIVKYRMSRTAIHTILRLEAASQKSQHN